MYLFDWIMLFTFHYLRNVSNNIHLVFNISAKSKW